MKPRNREINIFNISMLDVISGALGAFLIIMIVLFPYYKKESIDYQKEIQELRQQVQAVRQRAQMAEQRAQKAEQEASEARAEAEQNRQRARAAEQKLAKTFLVVYIRWGTEKQDIDLHVIDPSGAEFYYSKKTIPGRPGELSVDSQRGPGNEVWEIRDAPPGKYRVYANLFEPHKNNAIPTIKGKVFYRDGSSPLSEVSLTQVKEKKLMATIVVKPDGNVQVR